MIRIARGLLLASTVVLAACESLVNPPLIFGQTQSVGITVAGSPVEAGGEITLGYRDRNIAIIPVSVTQPDGEVTQLFASVGEGDPQDTDAMSVLGQFEVDASSQGVGLGKFFATGVAAQKLADGFAAKLGHKSPPAK